MKKREIIIILIAATLIAAVFLFKPAPELQTKTVETKSTPVQLPPKIITVTERVPDGIALEKLEECRDGFHDAIVQLEDLKRKVDSEDGISKDDKSFEVNDLARIYGLCW